MEIVNPAVEEIHRLDLLDRQEFVDRMLTIAAALSDNKKNSCYAVNGDWGVGKSFVLDMFEEQAGKVGVEGETLSRYLLFRYNCWEYDYYEEPLVAIVAAMLDQINDKVDLLSADIKERIVAALKAIGKGLVKKAVQLIEDNAGIDLDEMIDALKHGGEEAEKAVKGSHEYDQYFDFKKKLEKLRETIEVLSKDQTIIFIVDELDRCLPEYTIKVLERLHHLFFDIPNVQVVISVDADQLEHIVRQIYGEETDVKHYLRKFIQFKLELDKGSINDRFEERFSQYTSCFEIQDTTTNEEELEKYKSCIFEGLDMRTRISVIERSYLLHNLLLSDRKTDYSYMCLEILLVVLKDTGIKTETAKDTFSIDEVFSPARLGLTKKAQFPKGLALLSEQYKGNLVGNSRTRKYYDSVFDDHYHETIHYLNGGCFFGKLLCAYRSVIGFKQDVIQCNDSPLDDYLQYGNLFWELLSSLQ